MTRWLAACAYMLALLPGAAAQSLPPEPALVSSLAASTLLLDVARAGPRLVAVGHRGHVVISDDDGQSWRQAQSVPVRTTLTAVFFTDRENGWIVGHDASILHSGDGGDHWQIQHRDPTLEAPLFSLWFANPQRGLAVGAYGLAFRTLDGGRNWRRFTIAEDEDLHLNHLFATPDGTLFVAAELGTLYRSNDNGNSWDTIVTASPGSFWGGLALRNGTLLAFGLRGHLYRSGDGGDNWVAIDIGNRLSLTAGLELENGRVVISGLGGTLLVSDDNGETFRTDSLPGLRDYSALATGGSGNLLLFGNSGVEKMQTKP